MTDTRPLLSALAAERWAMERVHLYDLRARAAGYQSDLPVETLLAIREAAAGADPAAPIGYRVESGVAIIEIVGSIMKEVPRIYQMSGCDATGTLAVADAIEAALADPAVDSILLYIDSPGGTVAGTQELADRIFAARSQKPVHALISDMAASAAYWLASQATSIAANSTALVGSIGVYMVLDDTYRYWEDHGVSTRMVSSGGDKGLRVDGTHIGDAELDELKDIVRGSGDLFIDAVARGRGMPSEQAAALATGRCWLAGETTRGGQSALDAGLIDYVENSDVTFLRVAETDRPTFATQEGEERLMGLFRRSKARAAKVQAEEEAVETEESGDEETKPDEQDTGSADPAEANPDDQGDESELDPDQTAETAEDSGDRVDETATQTQARLYVDALGAARASIALAAGTPILEALTAVRAEQDKRAAEQDAEIAKLRARILEAGLDGEATAVSAGDAEAEQPVDPKLVQNLGPNLARAAENMKLPGRS